MNQLPPRILPPAFETLSEVQKAMYQNTVRVLGAPVGPRMVLLHHEVLAQKWAALADVIKNANFSERVRELVVLIVARHWKADFEWYAHERLARAAGLPENVIDAIKAGQHPHFEDSTDAAVYAYCTGLQERHAVSDEDYEALRQALGNTGLIELTALIGHYTSVSITLVAHRILLPAGEPAPFRDAGE